MTDSKTLRFFAIAACSVCLWAGAALAQPAADTIKIVSVEPSTPLVADRAITFTVLIEVTLVSAPEADVALGFNSAQAMQDEMGDPRTVQRGTHKLSFIVETTPRDWGRLTGFHALAILGPLAARGAFAPMAVDRHQIPVREKPRVAPVLADTFSSLDVTGKLGALRDIASAASDLQAAEVVAVMLHALGDPDPAVRLAAVEAIDGRTQAADWLTTRFKPGAPLAEGRRASPPADWAFDGHTFRAQLQPELARLARQDGDQRIRAAAIDTIYHMVWLQAHLGIDGGVVALFADVYRQDSSPMVRSRVVYSLGIATSDHAELRAVLTLAFADGDATVRTLAAGALRKLHPALDARLRFVDVREEIARGLADANRGYRMAALTAIEQVPQDARELLSVVQRMAERDPDDAVRQLARRVLELMN